MYRAAARALMVDEFGSLIPGASALEFPTEARALQAFNEAVARGEVVTIKLDPRDYTSVE